MNNRLKILTLGWEFPPLYAGGLGPACYGLTHALSKHADVTVILPRSDENFKMQNVEIIGLNNWIKKGGHRKPRKVEISPELKENEPDHQPRKVEINKALEVVNDDRQPRKAEVNKLQHVAEDDCQSRKTDLTKQQQVDDQPRKAEVNRLLHLFNMDFSAYPLWVSRKALEQISFFSKHNLPQQELTFTEEESQNLFSEKDIYGPNILEKVSSYASVVQKVVADKTFDIIHAHDWVTFPAAVQLKHALGKPLIVHVHSLETDRVHTQSRNAVYEIERIGMMQADRILPVSNFTKGNIVKYYEIEEDKISPVYNGRESEVEDNTLIKKIRKQRNRKEKRILFLGRITAQKGPEYLFETVKKLIRKMPDVKVYVAGIGDQKEHLEWLVNSNALQKHFVFTGFLKKEDVKNLLRQTDAYIMPSVSEPFGLSAVEAAQFNIPCVISKQSGAAEVLPNTLKADFWDTDKLANYLFAVLKYKHLSATLTEKTQINLHDINWDIAAMKVFSNYKMAINNTRFVA